MVPSQSVVLLLAMAVYLPFYALPCECQSPPEDSEMLSKLKDLRDMFAPCGQSDVDLVLCLKSKSVLLLGGAMRLNDVPLAGDAVLLARDAPSHDAPPVSVLPATERELDASLPDGAEERNQRLDAMLMDGLNSFITTHVIKLRIPEEAFTSVHRSIEEYRGKKNKMMGSIMMMALMMKSMMVPMALAALALLAGKALMVGMIALVLSAVVALKKLASDGHSGGSYEVINVPSGHHHGRSSYPHSLAYSAHAPANTTSQ